MFERGFKSWCESVAIDFRRTLKLAETDPLPPARLAKHLDVALWTPRDLELPAETLSILLEAESDNWSAITVSRNGCSAIVYNPRHKAGRKASDLMHELAHIVIKHKPARMILSEDGQLALRTHDKQQEEEAAWLSGCLLLPRPILLEVVAKGADLQKAANDYGVSLPLLEYRINITGVKVQLSRRRGR